MAMSSRLISIQLGPAMEVGEEGTHEWWDKTWRTSFYKQPAPGPQWLGYEGLHGDDQVDRRVHGGVDRAVCVYPGEHYAHWLSVLPLEVMPHGAFGENFTTAGLLETEVCIGDTYTLGGAVIQVSQPRQPCWKLARRWRIKDLSAQVERTGFSGYYFRVLAHGEVSGGDGFTLQERPHPQWTVKTCTDIMNHGIGGAEAAAALSQCPALSGGWRDGLWLRARKLGEAHMPALV